MLFDEHTSKLPPGMIREVLDVRTDRSKERGITVLSGAHKMGFARAVADRLLFFDSGAIVEIGTPEKISDKPDQERTKQLLSN